MMMMMMIMMTTRTIKASKNIQVYS